MSNYPKCTILMSVYNDSKYLAETIKSILKQTFDNFEFIIVNDGSTDNSLKIIKSFKDPRIKLINNKKNLGLTKSLNIGIKKAEGKYIARLDSDDISLPDRIEKQYNYLEKNKNISLIGASAEIIDHIGNVKRIKRTLTDSEEIKYKIIFIGNPLLHSSIFFRKSVIDKLGGYNENYKYAQDYELYSRLIKNKYQIANIPQILIKYRIHEQSIGQNKDSKKEQDANVKKIIFNNINHYLPLNWEKFEILYNKEKMRGIKNLLRAIRLHKQIFKNYILKEKLNSEQIKKIKPIYKQRQKWIIKQYIKHITHNT